MLLKQLWYFNKKATVFFLLFICLWMYLTYKQGAVATPLLQYGMYSAAYHISDTQKVLQLYINNKAVDFSKLSMSARDQLQVSLENYLIEKENNEMVFTTMQRILNKAGIGQWMKKEYYTNTITDEIFTNWYKKTAENITGEKIVQLAAFQQQYIWFAGKLTAINSPVKLYCIVAF
ncbi:MAG: hypothetical protein H7320_22025 [Ferruginibacter sp.]|nr:hypothetical protein [Ferruginibacter sp.]